MIDDGHLTIVNKTSGTPGCILRKKYATPKLVALDMQTVEGGVSILIESDDGTIIS